VEQGPWHGYSRRVLPHRLLPVLIAALSLAAPGCAVMGSNEDAADNNLDEHQSRPAGAGPAQVAASDVETVILARQTITDVCGGDEPRSDLIAPVERVRQIIPEGPSDRFESGQTETPQTMSSVALDHATVLDRCRAPELAARLRQVATGELPVQKGSPGY
jgi:hypothetical protein